MRHPDCKKRTPVFLFATIVLALVPIAPASPSAGRPVPGLSRVLLISVDGLRPDLLLRANTPTIRGLMERGSYSMWARTTPIAVTLPSHTSMLTGVSPSKHGIEWNQDLPLLHPVYPNRPTLFELAHRAGYTTAMAAGKPKFSALAKPGTLNWCFVPVKSNTTDEAVADTAARWIDAYAPQVLFVHLPSVDLVGHEHGWGSGEQIRAIANADQCIGRILEALGKRHLLEATLVLVTADHGGAGRSHGPDDPRSRTIPWIVAGPGLCRGLDLTGDADLELRTEDTFATICWLLGIELREPIDGHPVTQVLCRAHQH